MTPSKARSPATNRNERAGIWEESHHGILIVRLRQPNRYKIRQRVMQAKSRFEAEKWPGLLVVMRDMVQSVWRAGESM